MECSENQSKYAYPIKTLKEEIILVNGNFLIKLIGKLERLLLKLQCSLCLTNESFKSALEISALLSNVKFLI